MLFWFRGGGDDKFQSTVEVLEEDPGVQSLKDQKFDHDLFRKYHAFLFYVHIYSFYHRINIIINNCLEQ